MHRAALVFAILALAATPALADPVCTKLAWPMAHERALLNAPARIVASGTTIALADEAFTLSLKSGATLPFPSQKPSDPAKFAGHVVVLVPVAGDYLVSLSGEGWIDAVVSGADVNSTAHTSDPDCPGLRKSVRFTLPAAPVTIEISNAPSATINLIVSPAR
jgi:hypothetical protein